MLILASASPRRSELLGRIGVAFEVRVSDIDESRGEETPDAYVRRLAAGKANAAKRGPGDWVIGADTIVALGLRTLGKPKNEDEARAMLGTLSGKSHEVITGVALVGDSENVISVTTSVSMREIDEREIEGYVKNGEWKGKAGGYAIQGQAAAFVESINGSVTNVIGLPLSETTELLKSVALIQPTFVGPCA